MPVKMSHSWISVMAYRFPFDRVCSDSAKLLTEPESALCPALSEKEYFDVSIRFETLGDKVGRKKHYPPKEREHTQN